MKDLTKFFYEYIFPDIDTIKDIPTIPYQINSIMFKNILLYGYIASGKTELARRVGQEAVNKYGKDKVDVIKSTSLESLMRYGLTDKLINILFMDDITLSPINKSTLRDYFRIRKRWLDITNRPYGYLLSILSLHRFFSTPPILRSNLNAMIFKNSSTNPYDASFISRIIGIEAFNKLQELELQRDKDPYLKSWSIVKIRNKVGLLHTPLASHNYLKELRIIRRNLLKKPTVSSLIENPYTYLNPLR